MLCSAHQVVRFRERIGSCNKTTKIIEINQKFNLIQVIDVISEQSIENKKTLCASGNSEDIERVGGHK
jgi:hypothetical protein